MVTKARNLDIRYCGADPATGPGPIERRLLSFGPVRGLVFGHRSEASEHVESLLSGAAQVLFAIGPRWEHVNRVMSSGRWPGCSGAAGGMTAWRANARLLLDRLEYVGRGAVRAAPRERGRGVVLRALPRAAGPSEPRRRSAV